MDAASPETSTSSVASTSTGEVGSSASDYGEKVSMDDLQFLVANIELAISRVNRVRSGWKHWQENIYGNIPYWLVMIKGPQKPMCVFSPFFAVGVEKRRKYWKEREVFCW